MQTVEDKAYVLCAPIRIIYKNRTYICVHVIHTLCLYVKYDKKKYVINLKKH